MMGAWLRRTMARTSVFWPIRRLAEAGTGLASTGSARTGMRGVLHGSRTVSGMTGLLMRGDRGMGRGARLLAVGVA
jgi:hypothetical protein